MKVLEGCISFVRSRFLQGFTHSIVYVSLLNITCIYIYIYILKQNMHLNMLLNIIFIHLLKDNTQGQYPRTIITPLSHRDLQCRHLCLDVCGRR